MKITQGPSPVPTKTWAVPGGQCTRSHACSGRSWSSMIRTHVPASTRKSSWHGSAWYIPFGVPGSRTTRVWPSCSNGCGTASGRSISTRRLLSNTQRLPRASLRTHAASPTLTTNQPGLTGASPEPTSSSRASSTIVGTRCAGQAGGRGYNRPSMVDLIPREVLFGNPERLAPAVSPDGHGLAHIAPVDGILNVWVGTLGGDDARPVSHDTERGVRSFAWCEDNRHIVYPQDAGGDENWHLHVVDLEAGGDRDVTPFLGVQARMLAHDRRHPHHLLVGLNRDNPQLHDVYRLDVRDGSLELLARNPGFASWLVDADLRVRGGIRMGADGGAEVQVGDPASGEYRTLVALGPDDALVLDVAGFTDDGSGIYLVTSLDANAARLLQMDVETGESQVLAEDPLHDVSDVEIDPATHRVQVVTFLLDRSAHAARAPAPR